MNENRFVKNLKAYWSLFVKTLSDLGVDPRWYFISILLIGVFALQVLNLVYFTVNASDAHSVINALDNDGANAIDVARRSLWITSNDFYAYGPLYFRISNSIASLLSPFSEPGGLSLFQAKTKAVHFALLLTSVLAVMGLSFLSAWIWLGRSRVTWILAALFGWAFLFSEAWQEFILRAHPDHLLGFTVGLACWATFLLWTHREDVRYFRLSAWCWGVALSVKLSVLFFLPFVGFGLLWPWRKTWKQDFLAFSGHLSAAYFFVGFPQNLNVPKNIKFLFNFRKYSGSGDWESMLDWLRIFKTQLLGPALILATLILFALLCRQWVPKKKFSFSLLVKVLLLSFGPMALSLGKKVLPPHDHYGIPLVAAPTVLLSAYICYQWVSLRTLSAYQRAGLACTGLLFFYFFGLAPRGMEARLVHQLNCRSEARAVFKMKSEMVSSGAKIFADPYMPAVEKAPNVKTSWKATKAMIAGGDFEVLALKDSYYVMFLRDEMLDYVRGFNPDWAETRAFYQLFFEHQKVDDPVIGRWTRSYHDSCGFEFWNREK